MKAISLSYNDLINVVYIYIYIYWVDRILLDITSAINKR